MKQSMNQLAHKIELNKEQRALKKAQTMKKYKRIAGVMAFILLVALMVSAIDKAVTWARTYTIVRQRPIVIKFQKPLEIISLAELKQRKEMEELTTKIANEAVDRYLNPPKEKVCAGETAKVNPKEFFEIIWKHESGKGTNTDPTALHIYCRNKGKWNEIGYNPQDKFCFGSKTEAELYVAYYLEKNCSNMTMKQALCRWNTGTASDTCAYAEGNLSLAK